MNIRTMCLLASCSLLFLGSANLPAKAQFIDCDDPRAGAEEAVCDNDILTTQDVSLARRYRSMLQLLQDTDGDFPHFTRDKNVFIRDRRDCGYDVPCIRGVHRSYDRTLSSWEAQEERD